jgi:hypothetical protein
MFYSVQKFARHHHTLCALTLFVLWCAPAHALSSLNKSDAYPVFGNWYEHEYFLSKPLFLAENAEWAEERGERFSISVNGFFQSANSGKSMISVPRLINNAEPLLGSQETHLTELLDLTGESGMIPLLFGALPEGVTQLPPLLLAAQNFLYPLAFDPPLNARPLNFEDDIDPEQLFGFFSLPAVYKKSGVRIDMELDIICGIGLHLQGGFSSICQVGKTAINLTCLPNDPCYFVPGPPGGTNTPTVSNPETITETNVNKYLMNEFECIMKQMGYDICTFQKTSCEEIRLQLFWRHAYPLNTQRPDWPQMHVIPFIEGGVSFSPGRARDTSELYGLPFGNNKHTAAGFTTGLDLNFIGTIEIGGAFGYTHFFDRDFDCFRVPNSKLQHNLFPFTTSVNVQPGHNIHFEGSLIARHFLGNLSMFFQYINLDHQEDCITVKNGDPAFVPWALSCTTGFKTKIANIGFTYDFTPNFSLGFLWQAPLTQRNTYKSTTVMFGVTGLF